MSNVVVEEYEDLSLFEYLGSRFHEIFRFLWRQWRFYSWFF